MSSSKIRVLPALLLVVGCFFAVLSMSKDASATPSIDGTCSGASGTACPTTPFSGTSATITVSTGAAAGCLVVAAFNEAPGTGSSIPVASVAKTGGTGTVGAFSKRDGVSGNGPGAFGASRDDLEVWAAPYTSALSGALITVAWAASVDNGILQGVAVTGTYGDGCSWDSSPGSSAYSAWTDGVAPALRQATNQAHDLLIAFGGQQAQIDTASSGSPSTFGGTSGMQAGNGAPSMVNSLAAAFSAFYLTPSVAAGTISTTVKVQNPYSQGCAASPCNGSAIADALTSDPPPGRSLLARMLMGVGK